VINKRTVEDSSLVDTRLVRMIGPGAQGQAAQL